MKTGSSRACLGGLAILTAVFVASGWGHWGTGVYGDHALDLVDALRFHRGEIPYHDFLPTYGALSMVLVAPLFSFGNYFFTVCWLLTAACVAIQIFLLVRIVSSRISAPWLCLFAFMLVSCIAFAPVNGKWMMGYSPSGYFATILWTILILLLWKSPVSSGRWFPAGLVLGLLLFTKIDMGIAACLVLIALSIAGLRSGISIALRLMAGFLVAWSAVIGALMAYGARVDLLSGSTLETFGQAGIFGDATLKSRMIVLGILGMVFCAGFVIPQTRSRMIQVTRSLEGWLPWILPGALAIDAVRGWNPDSLKQSVAMGYVYVMVWGIIAAHLLATLVRRKSLGIFRFRQWPLWVVLMTVSGIAILRVSVTGWYPLNYSQPALLLIMIFWFARRGMRASGLWKVCVVVALGMQIATSLKQNAQVQASFVKVETPFGRVPLRMNENDARNLDSILALLRSAGPDSSLLCTYEPSLHLLTGLRCAEFYTYFNRLGFTGRYQEDREIRSLALLQSRKPLFIVAERERATFSRYFGNDFAHDINDWIQKNYRVVYESPPGVLRSTVVYKAGKAP